MKYQIAEYVIDTARYRISSGDSTIAAEPKVFDLLVYLIGHRDRVLSREELFREVWDGREVSDATLSNHVKSARKILGDSGELQKTILTIRGRGYQFIAPVTVLPEGTDDSAKDSAKDELPAPASPQLCLRKSTPPAASTCSGVAVSLGPIALGSVHSDTPLITLIHIIFSPNVVPDGTRTEKMAG